MEAATAPSLVEEAEAAVGEEKEEEEEEEEARGHEPRRAVRTGTEEESRLVVVARAVAAAPEGINEDDDATAADIVSSRRAGVFLGQLRCVRRGFLVLALSFLSRGVWGVKRASPFSKMTRGRQEARAGINDRTGR